MGGTTYAVLPFSSCGDTSFHDVFGNTTDDQLIELHDPIPDSYLHVRSKTSISGLLLNARSICNKQQKLKSFMELNPVDITCVTETWLSAGDTETLSLLPGYTTIRRDRDSRGSGIMAIINDTLLVYNTCRSL